MECQQKLPNIIDLDSFGDVLKQIVSLFRLQMAGEPLKFCGLQIEVEPCREVLEKARKALIENKKPLLWIA